MVSNASSLSLVHPHACGEIDAIPSDVMYTNGTSPRLWGDSPKYRLITRLNRYIPTPVGRFNSCLQWCKPTPVHPHACGEIPCDEIASNGDGGTSPRLWGDFGNSTDKMGTVRYIPTPVGRFHSVITSIGDNSVHPHACGEITNPLIDHPHPPGTSPRLWGDSLETENISG